jgi:hypothetical protein
MIFVPKNSEYYDEINRFIDEGEPESFEPKSPLVLRSIVAMRIPSEEVMWASAEAVVRENPGQGEWHVVNFYLDRGTAHVDLEGGGWAGVSYYVRAISNLIKKTLLQFPDVKNVRFD